MSSSPQQQTEVPYGFYGRLKSEFPSQVIVAATEVCNLACIHCPHPEFKQSEHYSARFLEPELNARLIDEVREHGADAAEHVRYTGEGEPLIHPKWAEMLEYAASRTSATVSLTTNGVLLDDPRIERLLATGVGLVDISIDAFEPETYERIRVRGDLSVTRDNVRRLIQRRSETGVATKIVVSYIEQPENQSETKDFERYWNDQGADRVVVRRLHSAAGAIVPIAQVLRKGSQAEPRRPCLYPWERILLNPRGELIFCPQDWVHGSVIADYRTTTVRETWQGPAYARLREAHLGGDYSDHGFCGQCPDWKETRWPGVGLSYADLIEDFKDRE